MGNEADIAAALQAFNIETAEPGESTEMIVDEADEQEAEEKSTLTEEAKDQAKESADEAEEEEESTLNDGEEEEDEEEAEEDDGEEYEEEDEQEAGDETPTLPDAYYRAAIHQGMTKEEVFEMFDANPTVALKTLASIYKATNNLSAKFASAGQATLKKQKDREKEDAEAIKRVDIEALEEEYGKDDKLVVAMRMQAEQMDAMNAKLKAAPEQKTQEDDEDCEHLNTFFAADDMKQYDKFYGEGKDWGNLTRIQETNRWNVIAMADQILAGAEAMDQKLKVSEALNMAHINVSEPVRTSAIRDDIKKKIIKRSKGRSLPSSSGKQSKKNKGKDERSLEQKTKDRLSKL